MEHDSYDTHRQQLIAASLRVSAAVISVGTVVYAVSELVIHPVGFRPAAVPYAILVFAPWVAVWLARGPLGPAVEWIALATDVVYTVTLATLLVQPTTSLSGAALFFSLKMLGTALFFPWHARTQYLSAGLTLLLYWSLVASSGRVIEPSAWLHQVLGPLIAALFSAVGASSAERGRRALFDRGMALQASAHQLQTLLASVRDSEARLRVQQGELEHEVQVSAALARVGREIISALDTAAVLDRMCKLTMEALQC